MDNQKNLFKPIHPNKTLKSRVEMTELDKEIYKNFDYLESK